MTFRHHPSPVVGGSRPNQVYAADLLPRLQALLAELADVDFAYEKTLDAIRRGPSDPVLKQAMVAKLWEHHEGRRAPLARALVALQQQIKNDLAENGAADVDQR